MPKSLHDTLHILPLAPQSIFMSHTLHYLDDGEKVHLVAQVRASAVIEVVVSEVANTRVDDAANGIAAAAKAAVG